MELTLHELEKSFKEITAVDHVSYTMNHGVYGLLGVNGAGKTTLMRMLCTLIKPTTGAITLDGKDIFALDKDYKQKLGYLPQDFGFYPDFTVNDYMLYIASIKGLRPTTARKRTRTLLNQVGLTRQGTKKMKTLSGGMLRRVGIAQAMLNNPEILILDEPTAGLDPNERIRFRNLISELAEDRLVLLSTHIVSDIEFIANEIMLMKEGKLFLAGTSEDIVASMDQDVWSCMVTRNEADHYLKQYLVANVKTISQGVQLRILSEQPPVADAVQEEATLEDAFLHYFGEKGIDEDDGEV